MIEQYPETTEDALLRVRKDIKENVDCDELTHEQLKELQTLNSHLMEYEKDIKVQIQDTLNFAKKKLDNPNDPVDNIAEVQVTMNFYLADDNPYYRNDSDNLLVSMNQGFYDVSEIYGIDDGVNHNEFQGWDENLRTNNLAHPMHKDYHCWIFHGLYDHTQLHWEEILHIGEIDIDITLTQGTKPKKVPKLLA